MAVGEFVAYYNLVSAAFESDKAFEQFVTGVWSIDKLYYENKQKMLKKKHMRKVPGSDAQEESKPKKKPNAATVKKQKTGKAAKPKKPLQSVKAK